MNPELITEISLEHGGNFVALCDYFQVSPDQAVDFSASINPLGFPKGLDTFLASRLFTIKYYPDPENQNVLAHLSEYLGIPTEFLVAGNGSMELIDLILRVLKPESVGIVEPAFSEYRRLSEINGAKISDQLEGNDCVFAGNPGNPKGDLLLGKDFERLASGNKWLIVDEVFVEFAGEEYSYSRDVIHSENLIVIRSATKFFGLPGLRLGYLIAPAELVSKLKKIQISWSVNSLAQAAAEFIFQDREFQNISREFVAKERSWLSGELSKTGWIKPFPSSANFILCEIARMDAAKLFHWLGMKGIFIRACDNFQGLGSEFIRVAVRSRKENQRLIKTLSEIKF